MLKHRDICTNSFGDTRDTESLLDTACVSSEGHYHDNKLVIFNWLLTMSARLS
jgi:hypothetical protein